MRLAYICIIAILPLGMRLDFAQQPRQCATSLAQCPAEGCGGDMALNRLMNRTDPASDPDEWTVANLIELNAKAPSSWKSGSDRGPLQSVGEGTRVVLSGYLQAASVEPAQASNCFLSEAAARMIALHLSTDKTASPDKTVSAAITPRIRTSQPSWETRKLVQLARAKPYVRVTGWLLWNSELAGKPIRDRATAWEVHPVTGLEVCTESQADCDDGDGWVAFADYNPANQQ